jgi:hypothetical protein
VDLNDELLCAYLDDELDAAQRRDVAAALAADAGAQLRLQRMREADRDLKAALPLAGGDHFEAAMAARIHGRAPASEWRRIVPWAAAAAVAGVLVGYVVPHEVAGPRPGDFLQLAPAVQAMLEKQPSGEVGAGAMSVVLTFEAQDSRYCRLFRVSAQAPGEGLACRSRDGAWQLAAWSAGEAGSSDGFRPAGANGVIDAAMSALGGQPALDTPAEAALLQRDWRAP